MIDLKKYPKQKLEYWLNVSDKAIDSINDQIVKLEYEKSCHLLMYRRIQEELLEMKEKENN